MTDAERRALDKMLERDFGGPDGLDVTGPEADAWPVYVRCPADLHDVLVGEEECRECALTRKDP